MKPDQHKPDLSNADWRSIGKYLTLVYQIGFTVVVSVGLFLFIGRWLDQWLGLPGIFTIAGVIAGAAGSFYLVYKAIMSLENHE